MNNEYLASAETRSRMISATGKTVVIYRENPIFEYFSNDTRADAVMLRNEGISLIGAREIERSFSELSGDDYCIAEPYYSFRKGRSCSFGGNEWFPYPLSEERKFIISERKRIGELVDTVISEMTVDSTELSVSKSIKNIVCREGIALHYDPVVAFDGNTRNIWNKVGENRLKKIMYVEVAAKTRGLTVVYSNSFIATHEEEYVNKYKENIEGQEVVKRKFVEGKSTEELDQLLEKYRGDNLYLTTPLFPYSYHPIPGPSEVIRTGDTAVFDLWSKAQDFSFRKKVVAVAGSYRALLL